MTPAARLSRLGGAGPDLLLIHGFGSDRLSWAANAHAFLPTRTVWAVDLPGHGEAPAEVGDGSHETLAQALAKAVEPLARPFAVVGHSLGGAVALHLAKLVPEAVSSLVLIAPAGLGRGLDADFLDAFPRLRTEAEATTLLRRLVVRPRHVTSTMARHVLAGLDRPGRRRALATVAAALKAIPAPAFPDLPGRLVWGEADGINPFDPARAAPWGDRIALLPDTGHLPQVEAAGRVNRLVAELLEEGPGGARPPGPPRPGEAP